MQLSRHCRLAKWLLLFAWLALIAFGSPLNTILEPEGLAARPKSDRTSRPPGTMLNANDNVRYNAKKHNLDEGSNGLTFKQATGLGYEYIAPVEIAVKSLDFFYEAIVLKASGAWRNLPQEKTLTFTDGNLALSLLSDAPIPWNFVIHFANTMAHATEPGVTTTYNIISQDAMLSASVAIALRVIDHATGFEGRSQSSRKFEGVKLYTDYSFPSLRTKLRVKKQQEFQLASRSRSVSVSSTKARESPVLSLEPRTPPLSTVSKVFRLQKFHVTAIITPITLVASYLEDFYDLIALKVETGFWNSVPPMHSLVLKRWNYQLKFFCYAAPVPWDFIQEVAIDMSEWAAKGFTAQFDAVYKAVDQFGKEIFVSVAMEFMNNGDDSQDDAVLT